MNSLEQYVNQLFAGYKPNRQIQELRNEILSNLEAKVTDLTAQGMTYDEAVQIAKSSMNSIDGLVEGYSTFDVRKYREELLQTAVLYCLIAWIVTIPLGLVGTAGIFSVALPMLAVVLFIIYLVVRGSNQHIQKVASVHYKTDARYRKLAWILWILFVCAETLYTTALHMGSNLWFGRPVHISGPYQFAVLGAQYLWPLITVVIPLLFHVSGKLKIKHEAGVHHEN